VNFQTFSTELKVYMTDFVFDDSALDAQTAQSTLDTALSGADDGELFIERSASESLTFDDGRLKTANLWLCSIHRTLPRGLIPRC